MIPNTNHEKFSADSRIHRSRPKVLCHVGCDAALHTPFEVAIYCQGLMVHRFSNLHLVPGAVTSKTPRELKGREREPTSYCPPPPTPPFLPPRPSSATHHPPAYTALHLNHTRHHANQTGPPPLSSPSPPVSIAPFPLSPSTPPSIPPN